MKETIYEVPESQLFRLLEICSKANGCKHFGDEGCQCSGMPVKEVIIEVPKATAKQRNKRRGK